MARIAYDTVMRERIVEGLTAASTFGYTIPGLARAYRGRYDKGRIRKEMGRMLKAGLVTRTVRKEWDSARGDNSGRFGGAVSMIRHRAYYSLALKDGT
jgi:hypothetical protein